MQKSVSAFFCLCLFIVVGQGACVSHDFPQYVCEEAVTFANDIRPIIETKCAISGCHNGDLGSDLNWNNLNEFQERAKSGEVKFRVTNGLMPPSKSPAGQLSPEQINAIVCWSDQGALAN